MTREDALREIEAARREGRRANLCCANLRVANLHGANLGGANLGGANLRDVDLGGANLRNASLRGANLHGANLRGANLHGADLYDANLSGAKLSGAKLSGAKLPSPQMILSAHWGSVSNDLCLALMRYDCASCPDGKRRFAEWAAGGPCPYSDARFQRAALFNERRDLWVYGPPRNPITLVEMVLDEKCPGRRES